MGVCTLKVLCPNQIKVLPRFGMKSNYRSLKSNLGPAQARFGENHTLMSPKFDLGLTQI